MVADFELWGFAVLKIEKIENPALTATFEQKHQAMARQLGSDAAVNHQRRYHLSSAGWGRLCQTGLRLEEANEGLFGKGLYFSPDPQKCDGYWRKATRGEASAVIVASTGKDPATTRAMFACRVLLGKTYHFDRDVTNKTLRSAPEGFQSVAGEVRGQRELVVYENSQALLEYMITYEVPKELATHQTQKHDQRQQKLYQQAQARQRNYHKQLEDSQRSAHERQMFNTHAEAIASRLSSWQSIDPNGAGGWAGESCLICLESLASGDEAVLSSTVPRAVVLSRCHGHAFHADCITRCLKPPPPQEVLVAPFLRPFEGHLRCPACSTCYGVRTGEAPAAYAQLDYASGPLPGFESSSRGHYILRIIFDSGVQSGQHLSPGSPFVGKKVDALFPDTAEGSLIVLRMLEAHRRRLLFKIGLSATTGRDNVVTFASVHMKTKASGGTHNHGFPDDEYLDRVAKELEEIGVSPTDVMYPALNEERAAREVRFTDAAFNHIRASLSNVELCRHGQLDIIKWLHEQGVALGANPNLSTRLGQHEADAELLHAACSNGHLSVAKWLHEHGVALDGENRNGQQPIHIACRNGKLEVVKWLHEHGVALGVEADDGSQPSAIACERGHLDIVKWLHEHGAVLDYISYYNSWQPIHIACFHGKLEVAKWLHEHGVALDAKGNDGEQPIHCACENGELDVVKWLSEHGVALDAKDNDGDQPIHIACYYGKLELAKWLHEQGL